MTYGRRIVSFKLCLKLKQPPPNKNRPVFSVLKKKSRRDKSEKKKNSAHPHPPRVLAPSEVVAIFVEHQKWRWRTVVNETTQIARFRLEHIQVFRLGF